MSKKVSATNKLTATGILYKDIDGEVKIEVDGLPVVLSEVMKDFFDNSVTITVTTKKTFSI